MQEVLDVPNEVAAELAAIGDGVLGVLRDRLGCAINLRGNRLTLEGDDAKVVEARAVLEELVDLVEGGQEIGAGTVDTILNAIDQSEDVREIAQFPADECKRMLEFIAEVAAEQGLTDYRVVVNVGAGAGQTIFHLHWHILGGRIGRMA